MVTQVKSTVIYVMIESAQNVRLMTIVAQYAVYLEMLKYLVQIVSARMDLVGLMSKITVNHVGPTARHVMFQNEKTTTIALHAQSINLIQHHLLMTYQGTGSVLEHAPRYGIVTQDQILTLQHHLETLSCTLIILLMRLLIVYHNGTML